MIKDNIKLKQKLTDIEIIGFTQDLANAYFSEDEEGNVTYTPYLARLQFRLLFYLYCVEGLTFETVTDDSGEIVLENILEAVESDEELHSLFKKYDNGAYDDLPMVTQLTEISADAYDMAEFKKQQLIHDRKDSLAILLDALTTKVETLDISKFNVQSVSEAIVKAYLSSSAWEENHKEDNDTPPTFGEKRYEN